MSGQRRHGRDRTHVLPGRRRSVLLRYSDEEYAAVVAAAQAAGLTPTGYAAEAALAAARGLEAPSVLPLREALVELMAARGLVRRIGVNVNQAVRQLHATGDAPPWLAQAVLATSRAVGEVEQAATAVAAASRQRPGTAQRGADAEKAKPAPPNRAEVPSS